MKVCCDLFFVSHVLILISPALTGFQKGPGAVYKNVLLRQGARGPLILAEIHDEVDPHHPH